ncbi:hypothetical protein J14TS2_16570 [Bacillus sp. J14TS2]|uniref:hypothetical protein n=1 Tax=Bacillus sp. J14TS2 TaxID=2807188 RepID=UPI001B1A71F7|nr:hypothetical protein [Bacillus sp. J14TS2]GIN71182.1 hypothetical protein J14TS2_16570 [Bacillus sp. J14TS2]
MTNRYKLSKQQDVLQEIIKVLASNNVTYEDAPELLEEVGNELNLLCKQQIIQVNQQRSDLYESTHKNV